MYKIVAVIKKKKHLTRKEFEQHWQVEHPAYVAALPGIVKYRQNPAISHSKEWPYDGMAELWFESLKDIAIAYGGAAGKALFQHEDLFLDDVEWFIAEERAVELEALQEGPSQ